MNIARELESFENFLNKELVFTALEAAILFIHHEHPQSEILVRLYSARGIRRNELKEHYESQKYRERTGE